MNIGVYGGAFDPPHMAHGWLAGWALSCAQLDRLVIIPCWNHAFGKQMSPYEQRRKMCQKAFGLYGTKVLVSDIEAEIQSKYTVDLLRELKKRYPKDILSLLIGADEADNFHKWYEYKEVALLAKLVVIGRESYSDYGRPDSYGAPVLPNISSSAIRASIEKGSVPYGDLPLPVIDYILKNKLYQRDPAFEGPLV